MLQINEFAEEIQEYLKLNNPDITEITYKSVNKNNGIILHGIIAMTASSNITPIIYIDDLYNKYLAENHTIKSACKELDALYKSVKTPQINFDMDWFFDFEKAKENLNIKLINLKDNRSLLNDVPYFEYGDLAGIYQIQVNGFGLDDSMGSITVTKSHVAAWDISNEYLHESAMQNIGNNEYSIKSMREVIAESFGAMLPLSESDVVQGEIPMYVLTNKEKINGASGIICTDLLQSFSERIGSNLIVLPSSIHEVLLVPAQNENAEMLDFVKMVTNINTYEVDFEERLSNNAYFYNKDKHELQQGIKKTPMYIKLHDEQNERSSILGKLKTNQDNLKGQGLRSRNKERSSEVPEKDHHQPIHDKAR